MSKHLNGFVSTWFIGSSDLDYYLVTRWPIRICAALAVLSLAVLLSSKGAILWLSVTAYVWLLFTAPTPYYTQAIFETPFDIFTTAIPRKSCWFQSLLVLGGAAAVVIVARYYAPLIVQAPTAADRWLIAVRIGLVLVIWDFAASLATYVRKRSFEAHADVPHFCKECGSELVAKIDTRGGYRDRQVGTDSHTGGTQIVREYRTRHYRQCPKCNWDSDSATREPVISRGGWG